MRCVKLIMANFCQHQYQEVEFDPGLTAVIGPNGSGKSNFLGAIRMALTGENPNAGPKALNIRELAPKSEASYVELTFVHGAVTAVVRRNLRPLKPTATLTIVCARGEQNEVIEGDTIVTARIEQILEIDSATVNDIVIVAQTDIFGALDKTPAKRAAQFQKLFHTDNSEVIYKAVGDQLKTVQIPGVGTDLDELNAKLSEATSNAARLTIGLHDTPSHAKIQQHRDENNKCVTDYDLRVTRQLQQADWSTNLEAAKAGTAKATTRLIQTRNDLETIEKAQDGNRDAATQASVKLASLVQFKNSQHHRETVAAELLQLDQAMTTFEEPPQPDGYRDSASLTTEIANLTHEKQGLHQFINSFNKGAAECPTCGTPTSSLEDKLHEAARVLKNVTVELERVTVTQAASFSYDTQHARWHTNVTTTTAKRNQIQSHLDALPELDEVAVDATTLEEVVAAQDVYVEGIAEYHKLITSITKEIGNYDGQVSAITDQLAKLIVTIDNMPTYTKDQRTAAVENVTGWDQTAANRRTLESGLAVAETMVQETNLAISQLAAVKQEADMLTAWSTFAQDMRSVLHRDGAPRFVAQRNLARLQHAINDSLVMFETDFKVEATEGLSFTALFDDGVIQPVDRLSQGQMVILALSFRLALNLMFAENIGALYLDEPTAWLDEHHIRGFEPVLQQLKILSTARGLQCIIITHEKGLAPLFDAVIQL